MKKRIIISAMIMVMVCTLIGGATFALFTDSATNDANTFTAGSVSISIDRDMGDEPSTGPMFYSDSSLGSYPIAQWAPGDTVSRFLNINNEGSLDGKLKNVKAVVTGLEEDQEAYDEFIDNMKLRVDFIIPGFPSNQVYSLISKRPLREYLGDDGALVVIPDNVLEDQIQAYKNAAKINSNATKNFCFTATLDSEAGNPLQGKSPVVSFTVVVEQTKNND